MGDPAIDRTLLLGRTTISVLATTFTTAFGLTLVSLAATPIGWVLTAVAAVIGLAVPWAWQRQHAATGADRLAVWQLAPRWREPVVRAAEQAERLRLLALRSPDGPVADHFEHLAITADGYVRTLHQAALQADAVTAGRDHLGGAQPGSTGDADLEADMERIVGQLGELAVAAEALRQAQRRHLDISPLAELTAETERFAAAIEAEAHANSFQAPPGPEIP